MENKDMLFHFDCIFPKESNYISIFPCICSQWKSVSDSHRFKPALSPCSMAFLVSLKHNCSMVMLKNVLFFSPLYKYSVSAK